MLQREHERLNQSKIFLSIHRQDVVVVAMGKNVQGLFSAGPTIQTFAMADIDQTVVTGMHDQGRADIGFHLAAVIEARGHFGRKCGRGYA